MLFTRSRASRDEGTARRGHCRRTEDGSGRISAAGGKRAHRDSSYRLRTDYPLSLEVLIEAERPYEASKEFIERCERF